MAEPTITEGQIDGALKFVKLVFGHHGDAGFVETPATKGADLFAQKLRDGLQSKKVPQEAYDFALAAVTTLASSETPSNRNRMKIGALATARYLTFVAT